MPHLTTLKLRLLSWKQRFLLHTVISILSICSSFHLLQEKTNAGFLKSYLGITYRNFQINHSLSRVCNKEWEQEETIFLFLASIHIQEGRSTSTSGDTGGQNLSCLIPKEQKPETPSYYYRFKKNSIGLGKTHL